MFEKYLARWWGYPGRYGEEEEGEEEEGLVLEYSSSWIVAFVCSLHELY